VAIVLDAGGLIAIDNNDRHVGALLRIAQRERIPVRTSAAVVAQAWRDGARQANLARTLAGMNIVSVDTAVGRRIGELLARTGTADVVDGHVALLTDPGDIVITSDRSDIERLLESRSVTAVFTNV
jgi:hypothetical protein